MPALPVALRKIDFPIVETESEAPPLFWGSFVCKCHECGDAECPFSDLVSVSWTAGISAIMRWGVQHDPKKTIPRGALRRASEKNVTDVLVAEELEINTRQLKRWPDAAKHDGEHAFPDHNKVRD